MFEMAHADGFSFLPENKRKFVKTREGVRVDRDNEKSDNDLERSLRRVGQGMTR